MKNKYSLVLLITLLVSANTIFGQSTNKVTVQELKDHIYYLASDSLKGRKPGTQGDSLAATYIRNQFINAGLTPMADNGFQYFTVVTSVEPGINNELTFNNKQYIQGIDFLPMPFSANATVTGEVVFAGYGIDMEEENTIWNSYSDIDVDGKWVMVLIGDPEPDNDSSLFIPYGKNRDKLITAKDNNAAGIIYVNGKKTSEKDALLPATNNRVSSIMGLPSINITRALADSILGKNIAAIETQILKDHKPFSFETNNILNVTTDVERVEVKTQNVVAMLEGTDPLLKNEYIVVGAHYDHLGMGGHGSGSRMPDTVAVHYGADDNASGVAAVIELAGKLASEKENLKRSVIFMTFGAEEMGLLGSKYFIANPLVNIDSIVTMMNFDMLGRLDENSSLMISGTGTAIEIEPMLDVFEKDYDFNFVHSPEGYGASDHSSFYGKNIPVLFFFTGAHEDYHTPFDKADRINYEGEKAVLEFIYPILEDLATNDNKLTYAEAKAGKHQESRGRGLKVKLGIMPDFASAGNDGLGVDGVTPGGPASIAGMKTGDKIIAIEGMQVTNIYDYMARLKKLKKGQHINVDIIRDGKKQFLMVLL